MTKTTSTPELIRIEHHVIMASSVSAEEAWLELINDPYNGDDVVEFMCTSVRNGEDERTIYERTICVRLVAYMPIHGTHRWQFAGQIDNHDSNVHPPFIEYVMGFVEFQQGHVSGYLDIYRASGGRSDASKALFVPKLVWELANTDPLRS